MSSIHYNPGIQRTTIFEALFYEIKLNWQFIKRDILAVVLPGVLFTTKALLSGSYTLAEWVGSLIFSLLYFWAFLTCFCTSNQLEGLEEDKINKPDRPLPSGMVSLQGARSRFYCSAILALILGIYLGITVFVVVTLSSIFLHNFLNLGHFWMTKNLLVAVGMLTTLGAGWQMVAPLNSAVWVWLIFLSGVWLFLGHIQDFRDIEGDRRIGRVTFPIFFGERFSRGLLMVGFFVLPIFIHLVLVEPEKAGVFVWGWDVLFCGLCWLIAIRLCLFRSPSADDRTYEIFMKLYCLMIISSISVSQLIAGVRML